MLRHHAPQFISFEGTEGVGKSTAIEQFCQRLNEKNVPFIRTREPGGSACAEACRSILLDKSMQMSEEAELLLIFAARADHLHKTILPALERGEWVICDRFIDSTVAYQGFGRYHGKDSSLSQIDLLMKNFIPRLPDVTFWLDLDVETGVLRAKERSAADRFESEGVEFFKRVYRGFEYQLNQNSERIKRIDAHGTIDEVSQRIWQVLLEDLGLETGDKNEK